MTREEALQVAKPILFNTKMVGAILGGRKMVTRRIIKVPKTAHMFLGINPETVKAEFLCGEVRNGLSADWEIGIKLPYQVGDILYVRETWYYESAWHELTAGEPDLPSGRYLHRYMYKEENPDYPVDGIGTLDKPGWKPSIHMPKEAARIFLWVTGVRVERLQDITDEQIKHEGIYLREEDSDGEWQWWSWGSDYQCTSLKLCYRKLWNGTVKKSDLDKYGWNANPWVFVIEFERVEVSE